jgi:putative transcriptional regulator
MPPSGLHPPILLIAMPQVLDPFFHRSVVLLVHHDDEEGSVGFIVNRSTGIRVGEILSGMEIRWGGDEETVAYFGGPVQPQMGTVLYTPAPPGDGETAAEETEEDAATEVIPGVALTQHVGDLERLANAPPARLRLFLGYAGWGSGQLIEEILRNDWLTAPVSADLLFAADPSETWARALRSVGVDPASLPSWTPTGDEEAAN